jgi:hypothetical protein
MVWPAVAFEDNSGVADLSAHRAHSKHQAPNGLRDKPSGKLPSVIQDRLATDQLQTAT